VNVLAVTPLYPPVSRVGAWLSTHEFLRGLAERGHHVDAVGYLLTDAGYDLDGIHVHRQPAADLFDRADVVISHLGDNQQAAKAAAARGLPSVRMAHSDPVQKGVLNGAALVVCNSQATSAALAWDGPTIVAHPPVWPDQYRTTPGDKVTLINVSPPKGADLFFRIARALPHRQFLAVKGGYGKQRINKAANVTVIEHTADMIGVYHQTRILLIPSARESWGRVGIEAMCSGIPVIAAPTPGLLESLGPAGVFARVDQATRWVQEIERLHDPTQWAEASARALARAAEFDPAADVIRFAEAIEALVGVAA
jgi:glycosyltransferase involved in cell wall biosynthesis